ncbi:MAG: FeS-binding protein [Deltaproteobacteria bacterium]|nr:FeS-binding protein [Deltaproteobacteria bacterium]
MKAPNRTRPTAGNRAITRVFVLTMALMAFTGFGQMPIFKRYYVSDIPGMAWSADFYATHFLHYVGAMVLLGLFAYFILDYMLTGRKQFQLTPSAWFRIILMVGIVATGILRVFKNMPDVIFSPEFTVFIDISHLGFAMIYLFTALVLVIMKRGWVRETDLNPAIGR